MPKGAVGKIRKGLSMSDPTKYKTNAGKADVAAKPPKKPAK